ncbi:hypothetical protein GCM10023321_09270 [Pseudonocardia eucalypti]|uniref:Arsenate reductase n=1 Tax=Pseudonocardia eucalypti TaxID=648755 RepID=A0ABP9PJV0_9PSEU|nr:hypothetical protein [Pseudonocardia eucalypti]
MTSFQSPTECTLPTAEQPIREAEFAALFGTALDVTRVDQRWLRVSFADADGVAARVRDLARRESRCCSFFDFAVTRTVGRVSLDIQVPLARAEVLDGLAQLVRRP